MTSCNNAPWLFKTALFIFYFLFLFGESTGTDEFPFLKYYEIVEYSITSRNMNQRRNINKRTTSHHKTFNFTAFNRYFHINLNLDYGIFHKNMQMSVVTEEREVKIDEPQDLLLTGKLEDDPRSNVSGYIIDDQTFHGSITTEEHTFYLHSYRSTMASRTRHSIIYRHEDIIDMNTTYHNTEPLLRTHKMGQEYHNVPSLVKREVEIGNSCPILLAADTAFFTQIGERSIKKTLSTMAYHMYRVDQVFRRTQILEDQDNVGIVIAAMKVFEDTKTEGILASAPEIDVKEYLVKWSRINHSQYCLGVLFTYCDFNGVLGLAWLADEYTIGGICDAWSDIYNSSFNTLLLTFLSKGNTVLEPIATLTLAHEIGHAFGAKHDSTLCQPGGMQGNYIMYERSTDTSHPNNNRFSQCSIHDMRKIVSDRAHRCFTDGTSYCGNKIVEDGEQCDCGDNAECDGYDQCCMVNDGSSTSCLLRPFAQCSPKVNPCCDSECSYVNNSVQKVCREETECSYVSICLNGSCPTEAKPDKTICRNGSNVCNMGYCTGSICQMYNTTECVCHSNECDVCCRSNQGDCQSLLYLIGRIVHQPLRKACDFNGYCDGSGKCIEHVDEKSKQVLDATYILYFLKEKWFIFVAIVFGMFGQLIYGVYKCMQRHSRQTDSIRGIEMDVLQ